MSPALVALLLTVAPDPTPEPVVDTVVVCPSSFRHAMQPWFELRASQGHRIGLLSNLGSAEEIRGEIQRLVQGGQLRYVLLVGSADPRLYGDPSVRARSVPMHYAKARVNVKWGSTPTIPTDNWYAQSDLAGDENPIPSVAIGRLPADSPEELAVMVKKIVSYERSTDFGPWRQRINLVAGVGNFGPLADSVLESAARMLLTQNIPAEYQVSMTYGNWRSPFCPDPRRFHATTVERLEEGSLYWIYIGHCAPGETAPLELPGGTYPILRASDAATLAGGPGRPIAMFLSCDAGALDVRERCLASALVASPGGPVAVLAGTRVAMPYAMTVLATNLTDECFRGRCGTLGEAMLHAKQNMLKDPEKDDERRAMLDAVAAMISPSGKELAAERAEHVLLFNLIGDPLLRLRHPQPLEVHVAKKAEAGSALEIVSDSPIEGRATVELVLRRDRTGGSRPSRSVCPASVEELATMDEAYRQANDRRLRAIELAIPAGRFRATIDVPDEAAGACQVCLFVTGKTDMAMGSGAVEIVPPRKSGSIMAAFLPQGSSAR